MPKLNTNIALNHHDVETVDLTGKRAAVIGGTGGLGRAISRELAHRGAEVLVVGRTFRDENTSGIDFLSADLSLMSEAERVGDELPAETLDIAVFTTGIMAAKDREVTDEGIERDMAVSYLSRAVVLDRIADRLRPASRVFIMGMPGTGQLGGHSDLNSDKSYKSMTAHTNTVAANEALVVNTARRNPELNVFGLNPGIIKTNIRGNMLGEGSLRQRAVEGLIGILTPSPESYSRRIVPLTVAPELDNQTAVMFDNKAHAIEPSDGLTDEHLQSFAAATSALAERAGVTISR